MNRICFLIVFVFCGAVHAQVECDGIDTLETTRIYFINGIVTQTKGMNISKDRLQMEVGDLQSNAYRVAVNRNASILDLYEVTLQAFSSQDVKNFWRWLQDPEADTTPAGFV